MLEVVVQRRPLCPLGAQVLDLFKLGGKTGKVYQAFSPRSPAPSHSCLCASLSSLLSEPVEMGSVNGAEIGWFSSQRRSAREHVLSFRSPVFLTKVGMCCCRGSVEIKGDRLMGCQRSCFGRFHHVTQGTPAWGCGRGVLREGTVQRMLGWVQVTPL